MVITQPLRTTATAVILAITVAAAAGCGPDKPPPKSGTITAMTHESGHYETVHSDICVAYNPNTFSCAVSVPDDQEVWHDPTWTICLRDDDKPDHVGCIDVTEQQYLQYQPGGHFPDHR